MRGWKTSKIVTAPTHIHTKQPERNKHSLHTDISMHKQFPPCGVCLQRRRIDERNHDSVTITSGCRRSSFKSVFLNQNHLTCASRCHWKRQGVSISCTFGSQHSTKEPSVRNLLNKESHLAVFCCRTENKWLPWAPLYSLSKTKS